MKIIHLHLFEQTSDLFFRCQLYLEKGESFWLSDQLTLRRIVSQDQEIAFETGPSEPMLFRSAARKITPQIVQAGEIVIEYQGQPVGWGNVNRSDLLALNTYSVYYPQPKTLSLIPFPLTYQGRPGQVMLEGHWDEAQKAWFSSGLAGDPGNVVIYKPASKLTQENAAAQFVYFNPDETEIISHMVEEVEQILMEYQTAYGARKLPQRKMISLDIPDYRNAGAFQRGEWTFYTRILPEDCSQIQKHADQMIGLMAHELGHLWFTGADVSSWEDWLNETGAEWACLRYLMKHGPTWLLKQKLNMLVSTYAPLQPIRTPEGKNDAKSIHQKGTALFLKLAFDHGMTVVDQILSLLANLTVKSTAALLEAIRRELSLELAAEIEKFLDQADFGLHGEDPILKEWIEAVSQAPAE